MYRLQGYRVAASRCGKSPLLLVCLCAVSKKTSKDAGRTPSKTRSNQSVAANCATALFVIGVSDEVGNVIETHEHKGEFKEP